MQAVLFPCLALPSGGTKTRRKIKTGYPMPPGSGPAGETCKTCAHCCRRVSGSGKVFLKCAVKMSLWTSGAGTDIKAKSPACQLWDRPRA